MGYKSLQFEFGLHYCYLKKVAENIIATFSLSYINISDQFT